MRLIRSPLLLFPLVLLLVALVHWPGLGGPFLLDDLATIVDNPRVHAERIDAESLARAARAFDPGGLGRPLAMASFAVDHAAAGGLDARRFKLTNLLIHLVNTGLVALLALALLRRVAAVPAVALAGLIALVWGLHPLQASSVFYVVQRMETLSLTFVLLALLAYLRGRGAQIEGRRGWPWLLACLPLVALGLASKETAVLFPAFTLALELTVLRFDAARPALARLWRVAYGVLTVLAVLLFVFVLVPRYASVDPEVYRPFTTVERLLTQLRVLVLYLGQILLPVPSLLVFHYDNYPVSTGLLAPPSTLFSGLLLAALAAAAWGLRRRLPLVSLGLLLFFAAHLLTSNIIPLELAFEHRNYFALFGIVLALVDLLRRAPAGEGLLRPALAVLLPLLVAFLALLRSATWGDTLHLYTELAERNPGSARASADLGAHYLEMTDGYPGSPFYDFALREFERGSQLPGSSIISDQGLILTAASGGRPVEDLWWQRLIDKLRTGHVPPEATVAMFSLLENRYKGIELDDDRLVEAFIVLFERVAMPPHSYAQFGDYVLTRVGDQELADQVFRLAIERSKDNPDYARQVVEVLTREGHLRQARVALRQAQAMGMLEDLDPEAFGPGTPPASPTEADTREPAALD